MLILDPDFAPILIVKDNDIALRGDDLWDFSYGHNLVKAWHVQRDVAVTIDLREPEAELQANLWLGKKRATFRKSSITFPKGSVVSGNFMSAAAPGAVAMRYCEDDPTLPIRWPDDWPG